MPPDDQRESARASARRSVWLVLLATLALPAHADSLRPHEVVYRTSFKGINAGELRLRLTPDKGPDAWLYETHAAPTLLASIVISARSLEQSRFRVTARGVEPHHYSLSDGSAEHSNDTELAYDWLRGHVSGRARGETVELDVEPGTQDAMSIRAAVVVDLLAGREPHDYAMIDGRELKHYVYRRGSSARLDTALGPLDTVIFTSDRKGSDGHGRSWRYWYAPTLDWLPVRIEQREDGRTRLLFVVRSLKWLDAAPAPAARDPH